MRRILYTTPSANVFGGGQVSLLLLIEKLDRGRYAPILLVPAEGEMARRARAMGCAVRVVDLPPLRRVWAILPATVRLRGLLGSEGVALIHSESPRMTLYAALARLGLGIPLIWHIRTMLADPLDPLLERAVDRIVLVARALSDRFSAAGRRKATVIYNGIDLDRPAEPPPERLPAKSDPLIVCAGRLYKDKGQATLVEAAARLKEEFPGLSLWLVGRDHGYAALLDRRARELGVRVEFLGHREDVRSLLALADVVALCSLHEAFPRVPLEAMAEGKAVVATKVGGVGEAVIDGETGLLVPPGDPAALAEALGRLLKDPALRERMGHAGRGRVRRFLAQETAAAAAKLYDELLASSAGM